MRCKIKTCECGSNTFIADVISGTQEIMIDEDGEIIECETEIYEVGWFKCVECVKIAEYS